MLIRRNSFRCTRALALASVVLLAGFAHAQSSRSGDGSADQGVAGTQTTSPFTQSSPSNALESDVATLKADNAAVREQLRMMEERQKGLLALLDQLQQRLDAASAASGSGVAGAQAPQPTAAESSSATQPSSSSDLERDVAALKADNAAVREQLRRIDEQQNALVDLMKRLQQQLDVVPAVAAAPAPGTTPAVEATSTPVPPSLAEKVMGRYDDGIVIAQAAEDAKLPFMLKLNNNTQVRYLNTTNSDDTFTDHLGVVRDVHPRNDITVNRTMFILGGYIFDKRLRYSSTVWTSAGAASIVVAGNIGWSFNKAITVFGGYTGVPGSRSLVNTFPFFTSTDRTMADNFFRPGFTQGLWATGEPAKGWNYLAFVGNGLNTLNISANKIDPHLLFSGSVWWEPLGDYGEPGKARNMYDDYFAKDTTRIRVGTAYTRSREDRFSNLDQSSPENTSLYNSDGVLTFSTGAFAPGVTVEEATYQMWAIDGGLKRSGLAINGQYFFRRIDNFEADGPLPLTSTYDHGGELSASYFVIPQELTVYARGSFVQGEFADSWEYAGGVKWHFLPTERLWLNVELMRVNRAPYSGAFTPYTAGMDGWVPMIQTILAF
jgi:hypothetical protein